MKILKGTYEKSFIQLPFLSLLLLLGGLILTGCIPGPPIVTEEMRNSFSNGVGIRPSASPLRLHVWGITDPAGIDYRENKNSDLFYEHSTFKNNFPSLLHKTITMGEIQYSNDNIPQFTQWKNEIIYTAPEIQNEFSNGIFKLANGFNEYKIKLMPARKTRPGAPSTVNSKTSAGAPFFILEVGIQGIAVQIMGFSNWAIVLIKAQSQLIDSNNGEVLFKKKYIIGSEPRFLKNWNLNGGSALKKTIMREIKDLQEWIVDEAFFLVDMTKVNKEAPHKWQAPWTLNAIEPAVEKCTGCRGYNEAAEVDTLQPMFRWEKFPRKIDLKFDKDKFYDGISDVSYEFRLYKDLASGDEVVSYAGAIVMTLMLGLPYAGLGMSSNVEHPVGGELIYKRTGLSQPEHMYEDNLQNCGNYLWSVRAWFNFQGKKRVTDWASAVPHDDIRPSLINFGYSPLRKGTRNANPSFVFYRLNTPCPEREKMLEEERKKQQLEEERFKRQKGYEN